MEKLENPLINSIEKASALFLLLVSANTFSGMVEW